MPTRTMPRSLAFLVALSLAACAKPMPVAPAPVALASPLTPTAVVQRSAATLVGAGFTIAVSDASAGVLTARQERPAAKMSPEITCFYGPDAVGARGTRLTMTVSVSAAATAGGSSVTIATAVRQQPGDDSVAKRLGASTHTDDACASTGEVEKRLAAALSVP